MKINDFDRIAWLYDPLKRLVFGGRLEKAASFYFSAIKKRDSVLIVGGGTGRILHNLKEIKRIDYVDQSKKMIKKAQKIRTQGINYHQKDFQSYESDQRYHVIILPFFLDVLIESELKKAIIKLKRLLHEGGYLLVSDFDISSNSFQKAFISLMYIFFNVSTNISASKLLPIHQFLLEAGFREKKVKKFGRGMIFSRLYENSETL